MSTVSRLYPLSGLAALVLVGCSSQPAQPLKREKAVDVASVVRQKMPASVKDRDAWAQDLAKTFESQKLAPTVENICSVLAVAQQESNFQADPAVPGLSKIAWKEIDRRAERMHIPLFVVHTALKINSPTGKSYSERLDTVKTENSLAPSLMISSTWCRWGRHCSDRLIRYIPVVQCRSVSRLLSSTPAGIRGKWRGRYVRKCLAAVVGCGSVRIICSTTRRITVRQSSASPILMPDGMRAAMQLSRMRSVKPVE